jgi:hypothetical protein
MYDIDIVIPGIVLNDSDDLIGEWAPVASLPMYDDQVIRWYADDRGSRRSFKHIERETGINFKRTKNIDKAEIISDRGYTGNPTWSGVAKWSSDDPVWKLTTRKGGKYRSTILHEICHALGMTHPENHAANTDTIMSYNRDRSIKKLFPRDIDILTGLYINETTSG